VLCVRHTPAFPYILLFFFCHVSDHHSQRVCHCGRNRPKSEISRLVAQVQSDLRFKNELLAASGDSSSTQLTAGLVRLSFPLVSSVLSKVFFFRSNYRPGVFLSSHCCKDYAASSAMVERWQEEGKAKSRPFLVLIGR